MNKQTKQTKQGKQGKQTKHKRLCDKSMTFEECELAILREAVDKAEEIQGQTIVNNPDIQKIISIVENFIRKKKLICYGGTAINNILPKQAQFYNKDIEISDYDFFSVNALEDAKELADLYIEEGFSEVEAKSGQHKGTYKVFVNFIPTADITHLAPSVFKALKSDAIKINGILYAPANFLRMSMYLELSRPAGDVSRWEKVLKRLTLLNTYYPLKGIDCNEKNIQREMTNKQTKQREKEIFEIMRNTFVNQGVVFIGGYSIVLYSRYMPHVDSKELQYYPDFDVISEDPKTTAAILKEQLEDAGIQHVKLISKPAIGEIIAPHIQVTIGNDTTAFIYAPIACYSYNIIKIHGYDIKIGTIDTILSFYLAFLYSYDNYHDKDRLLCIAQFLFEVQQQNRLSQNGLLKRFSVRCYGHQQTLEEIRAEKSEMYNELKNKKNTKEYEELFLRYRPADELFPRNSIAATPIPNSPKKANKHTLTQRKKKSTKTSAKTREKTREKTKKNFIQRFLSRKRKSKRTNV